MTYNQLLMMSLVIISFYYFVGATDALFWMLSYLKGISGYIVVGMSTSEGKWLKFEVPLELILGPRR